MLVLVETAAGYAIFRLMDDEKLRQTENLYHEFETPEAASRVISLLHFQRFENTTEALAVGKALSESRLPKLLKKTLREYCQESQRQVLAVADAKLGRAIAEKLNLSCISDTPVQELMRCIKRQLNSLLGNISQREMTAMRLGLAHSISRYNIKYSSDKIDTMVIQSICVLDELDKQINNYMMRAREWFGWHFPELGKILKDNFDYIRTMQRIGMRDNAVTCDMSDLLSEDQIREVREAAETSMGSEITEYDADHMRILCVEILELDRYRSGLKQYLTRRMMILAPNLTILVGDMVAARLISKAGSLRSLAKQPASTLQILGAEKALFRALKAKKNTPKYGLIYHAELVASAAPKNKGKASRMLAAKAALATRFDALGEEKSHDLGIEHKEKLQTRLRRLENGRKTKLSGTSKAKAKFEKYHTKQEYKQYSASVDSTLPKKLESTAGDEKKCSEKQTEEKTSKKKKKKHSLEHVPDAGESSGVKVEVKEEEADVSLSKKKKKKRSLEYAPDTGESSAQLQVKEEADVSISKKKKKKHSLEGVPDTSESSNRQVEVNEEADVLISKKKKKKHSLEHVPDVDESSSVKVEVKEEEADVSLSKKKKKKRSLEHAPDTGESSGAQLQVKEETDVSISKKKKKKHSLEGVPDTSESSSTQVEINEEADVSVSKKKKKKHSL